MSGDGIPADNAGAADLVAATEAALLALGRRFEVDREIDTFEIQPAGVHLDPVVAVVFSSSRSVVFYAVWSGTVMAARRPAMAELAARMNTVLVNSACEFDMDTGIVCLRAGVEVGDILLASGDAASAETLSADAVSPETLSAETLSAEAFSALINNALTEVEWIDEQFRDSIEAVAMGDQDPKSALRSPSLS